MAIQVQSGFRQFKTAQHRMIQFQAVLGSRWQFEAVSDAFSQWPKAPEAAQTRLNPPKTA